MPVLVSTFSTVLGALQSVRSKLLDQLGGPAGYPLGVALVVLGLIYVWLFGWTSIAQWVTATSVWTLALALLAALVALYVVAALLSSLDSVVFDLFQGQWPFPIPNGLWSLLLHAHRSEWRERHAEYERWWTLQQEVQHAISLVVPSPSTTTAAVPVDRYKYPATFRVRSADSVDRLQDLPEWMRNEVPAGYDLFLDGEHDPGQGATVGFALYLSGRNEMPLATFEAMSGSGILTVDPPAAGRSPTQCEVSTDVLLPLRAEHPAWGYVLAPFFRTQARQIDDGRELRRASAWVQLLRSQHSMAAVERDAAGSFQNYLRAGTPLADRLKGFDSEESGNDWARQFSKLLRRALPVLQLAHGVIASTTTEMHQRFRLYYPTHESELAPTRIGNILRSANTYAEDIYGMDATLIMPKIQAAIGGAGKDPSQDPRTRLSVLEWAFLSTLAVTLIGTVLALLHHSPLHSGIIWLVGWLAAWLIYQAACASALDYAMQLRSLVDLHRADLVKALGLKAPSASLKDNDERQFWQNVTDWLEYGGPEVDHSLSADGGSGGGPAPDAKPGASDDDPAATSASKPS